MTDVTDAGTGARPSRKQHSVHTLPRDWHSLARVLTPLVERIDPLDAATQLLIITPDVESTVALVAGAFTHFGVQGIDIIPATGAGRAARLLKTDPARAIAGPPSVLRHLLGSSTLRLDAVRGIAFAWVDDLIEGGEGLADLETVLGEAPKDAVRVLVVRDITPAAERFVERHLHGARRMDAVASASRPDLDLSYVTTPSAARPGALRRVLDETDPPSAVVVVRTERSEAEARAAVRELGYRRSDAMVQVARTAPQGVHTVILYDVPMEATVLQEIASAGAVRTIALVEPRDTGLLRRLTSGRATPLERPEGHARARRSDELLRRQIRELLETGYGVREISTIEPLLAEYDAAEIAGALVRLLEREREHSAAAVPVHPGPAAGARPGGGRKMDARERPGSGRPRREGGGPSRREGGGAPRRDGGGPPRRDSGGPPRRGTGGRPRRDEGGRRR